MTLFSFPQQVNERAARVVAGVVALTLSLALVLQLPWLVPPLALGFLLRLGWGPRFSPLARVAMFSAARLWDVRPVTGAPKRFAQGIGALCTLCASALFAAGQDRIAWSLVGLVLLFATLEAALGFCMGCWTYARLQRIGLIPADTCTDCAPIKG